MSRRIELTLLSLILLLAAVMRMGWPGISEFKRDEALLSQMALDMARGRDFPLHGITSSVGIPNPPVSVYLFAIPYTLSADPNVATLFVGLLNVVAVALTWWLARRYLGAWMALLAAALYAAGPWGVIYSRKVWAQDLLPPFVLLTVVTGLLGFAEGTGRWRHQIAHVALLALTVQIHMAAASLIPLTLVLLIIGRRQISRRLWLGIGLAALTVAPFALAAARHDWLESVGGVLRGDGRALTVSLEALKHARRLIAGTGIHSLAGADAFQAYLDSAPNLWPLLEPEGALALAAAVWLTCTGLRQRKHPRLIFGLWVLLPILTFTIEWTTPYPHYLIALIPAGYIALAAGAKALMEALARRLIFERWVYAALAGLVMAVPASQVYLTLSLLSFLDTHNVSGAFGAPLHDLLEARDTAAAMAGGDEILVAGEGEDPETDEAPAVWRFLLYDHRPGVRFVDGRQTFVFPATPTLWLTLPDQPCLHPFAETVLTFPHGRYHLTRQNTKPSAPSPIDHRLANGVTFRGWGFERNEFLLWWETDGPADQPYSLFVHLLDGDGNRIARADVNAWRGPWRAGDVVVTRFDLGEDVTLPSGGIWRIGMYYFLDDGATHGVDVLDEAGNPAGWWVDAPTRE